MSTSLPAAVVGRFAAPALLQLGPPPAMAATQTTAPMTAAAAADLVARMNVAGIPYDVQATETDPGVILTEAEVARDYARRVEIDNAIAQTFLGSATGPYLDQRCADYGVVRRTVAASVATATAQPARPANVPPAWTWTPATASAAACWTEDDASLRLNGQLAWQALSVAGPAGAYVYLARQAHPDVNQVAVYGPESGYVTPGQVLLVIQSYSNAGVPTAEDLDAVAAYLDAWQVTYAGGGVATRTVRDRESIRPLGAQVFVEAAQPLAYYVQATLYVSPGNDPTGFQTLAAQRLAAYQAARNNIGMAITLSGLMAALGCADANGVPTVDEVVLAQPAADVAPSYQQIAFSTQALINVVIR